MWNVKTSNPTAITNSSMVFFDSVGDLYVGCLMNDAVITAKIDVVDGIKVIIDICIMVFKHKMIKYEIYYLFLILIYN